MKESTIVCDSSSIIALVSNCLLDLLPKFNANFVIPEYVRYEIFDYPYTTKRFGFEAMRTALAFGNFIKVMKADEKLTEKILRLANSIFLVRNKPIKILHRGEADAISLLKKIKAGALLVDERITRLLIENPQKIAELLEVRTKVKVKLNYSALDALEKILRGIRVIRSSELFAVAVKRGYINWDYPKREILEKGLYALKFSGCAISEEEISQIVKLYSS